MDSAPKKVLVVDDEKDLRDALHTMLEASGFVVFEAGDGEAGLTIAEAERPDIILLDIMMPIMDGHQVLNRLRQTPWGLRIPVLLLTNADDPHNIARGVELRSDDYLIKSQTSLATIIKKVKQHLYGYKD